MAVIGVNYFFETNGVLTVSGTFFPTAYQAFYCNQIIAQLAGAADADTTCTITHNWNLTQAQQLNLLPNIFVGYDSSSLGTVAVALVFSIATNTIAVTKKNTVAGSGGTYNVVINRPLNLTQ